MLYNMARTRKVFDKVLDKRASPEKEFGERGKNETSISGINSIEEFAKKLKNSEYYTRCYAALDLRDIAKVGGDIEPVRHLLIEMRDYDAAQNCRNAAKEALDAADAVDNERYDVWKEEKEAIQRDGGPYHFIPVNGKTVGLLPALRHGGNTVRKKVLRNIEMIAKIGVAHETLDHKLGTVHALKDIAEDERVMAGLNIQEKDTLRRALEKLATDPDGPIRALAEKGINALDGKT